MFELKSTLIRHRTTILRSPDKLENQISFNESEFSLVAPGIEPKNITYIYELQFTILIYIQYYVGAELL